jgi:hypothetical protein
MTGLRGRVHAFGIRRKWTGLLWRSFGVRNGAVVEATDADADRDTNVGLGPLVVENNVGF